MAERGVTVLVADDVQAHRESLCRALRLYGYQCESADSAEGAMSRVAGLLGPPIDLVVIGVAGPEGLGSEVVRALDAAKSTVPIVAIVGVRAASEARALRARGAHLLAMPFDPEALRQAIEKALIRSRRRGGSPDDRDVRGRDAEGSA